ncbi:MAG TPA: hypothetical protein VGN44_06495 [Candidatus Angelobacter sp.]
MRISTAWALLFVAGFMTAIARPADTPIPTQIPSHDAILMGAAWYPEQWPEAVWEQDLALMEASAHRRICLEHHGASGRQI